MPKKKFIDKKKAVTFHLVHRSQRDPLQASEDAGQRVLLDANTDPETRREEQRKYGVYYDDDYDYLQHLKDVQELNDVGCSDEPEERFFMEAKTKTKPQTITLPSTVFGSQLESEVGMLNKAAPSSGPKLDWDPDIVAGLDDDFDFEDPDNLLDDDFMMEANAEGGDAPEIEDDVDQAPMLKKAGFFTHKVDGVEYSDDDDDDDEDDDDDDDDEYEDAVDNMEDEDDEDFASDEAEDDVSDLGSLDGGFSYTEEETKSRFTQYSVSSSVIRRNEGLTFLDDRFEKFFEQYDDEELGALDHEDIDGRMDPNSKVLTAMMKEFEAQQNRPKLKDVVERVENIDIDSDDDDDNQQKIDEEFVLHTEEPKEKWDCESILSTYSNLYNHPTLIKEPKKNGKICVNEKTGMPMVEHTGPGLTLKDIQRNMNARNREDKACTYRPDDETTEERKARKAAVKQERKFRREEKKATKIAFRKEGIKHNKERINAARNEGVKMS